ncbi:MAG: HD domain-containing phosphohydrolase [Chloroflexota bacterium]
MNILHGLSRSFPRKARGGGSEVRMPIRIKITLPFLLMAIGLAFGAALVITQLIFNTIEERFTNQLLESSQLAAEWMVAEEESRLQTLRLLANAEGMAEALRQKDADRIRSLAYGIAVNNLEDDLQFLDPSGRPIFAMHHRPQGLIEEYDFVVGGDTDFLQWDFVRRVAGGQTDPLGDKYSGLARTGWGDFFYVAGPVTDPSANSGQMAGIILVGKSLDNIVRGMRAETLAQITLYDERGGLLASTVINPQPLDEAYAREILDNQAVYVGRRDADNQRTLVVFDIGYQEMLIPWEGRDKADMGLLGISLARNNIVAVSFPTRLQIALLAGSAFVLIILLGVAIANTISRPISSLVRASEQVMLGNLRVQVPPITNDEVAVLARTFNQMVSSLEQSQHDLLNAYDRTLEGWSKALELKDRMTEGHSQRVTELMVRVGRAMGLDEAQIVHVRRGAILHDIGKMGIPDEILNKPGKLTEAEWKVVRRHPEYALQMLAPIEYLRPALDIPYCHHERWDGSGYPRGLKGQSIPLAARIFAVVDTWDAISFDRPYRKAFTPAEARQTLLDEKGTKLDPAVVDRFLEIIRE